MAPPRCRSLRYLLKLQFEVCTATGLFARLQDDIAVEQRFRQRYGHAFFSHPIDDLQELLKGTPLVMTVERNWLAGAVRVLCESFAHPGLTVPVPVDHREHPVGRIGVVLIPATNAYALFRRHIPRVVPRKLDRAACLHPVRYEQQQRAALLACWPR